jgi:hypothetical protein
MSTSFLTSEVVVSPRAIRRLQAEYRRLPRRDAVSYIRELVIGGKRRPTPRHWMRPGPFKPGTRFVYSHREPDFCVIVRGNRATDLVVRGDQLPPPAQRGPVRDVVNPFDWRAFDLEEVA